MIVCAAALALTACATLQPPGLDAGAAPVLAGRMAVRVTEPGVPRPRSFSAQFELAGDADAGVLRLYTPLGTQMAQARWSARGVWLDTPQGEQRFDSLDALSQQVLGEAVPLAALPDWLRGRPAQAWGPTQQQTDGFVQGDWTITRSIDEPARVQLMRAPDPVRPAISVQVRLDG